MTLMSHSETAVVTGATIEYKYEESRLSRVVAHVFSGISRAAVLAMREEISYHIPSNADLIQEPTEVDGNVYIKQWKVIYE